MPGKHSETMGKGQVKINFLATESKKERFIQPRKVAGCGGILATVPSVKPETGG
jgi:hypothetical protein